MARFGYVLSGDMNEEELKYMKASYGRVIDTFTDGKIVLCNNIPNIDESIYDNARFDFYDEENDTYTEIYQYYLCNLSGFDIAKLESCGVLLTYSDLLDVDVICVDHWGTGWNYVLTDAPIFETWEEWETWRDSDDNE